MGYLNYNLSEEFLRKYQHNFNINDVIFRQIVSKIFIEEFKNTINWALLYNYYYNKTIRELAKIGVHKPGYLEYLGHLYTYVDKLRFKN